MGYSGWHLWREKETENMVFPNSLIQNNPVTILRKIRTWTEPALAKKGIQERKRKYKKDGSWRNTTKEKCRNIVQGMNYSSITVETGKKNGDKNFCWDGTKKKENVSSQLTEAKTQWIHLRLSYSRNSSPRSSPTKSSRTLNRVQGEEETPQSRKELISWDFSWEILAQSSRWEQTGWIWECWGHIQVSHPHGQGHQGSPRWKHPQALLSSIPVSRPSHWAERVWISGLKILVCAPDKQLQSLRAPGLVLFNTLISLIRGEGKEGIREEMAHAHPSSPWVTLNCGDNWTLE